MNTFDSDELNKKHPLLNELKSQYDNGHIHRRSFLRYATLLGMSFTQASVLCSLPVVDTMRFTKRAFAEKAKKKQRLRIAMTIDALGDPALFNWVENSNVCRHVCEYLTYTDNNNITHPYLAEKWEVSADLKTWIFTLRKDIFWHNGDRFTFDDVIENFRRWLDPGYGSSNLGLFEALLDERNVSKIDKVKDNSVTNNKTKYFDTSRIERLDDFKFALHCQYPVLNMPENLYNYPTMIMHKAFNGHFNVDTLGTGYYKLKKHKQNSFAVLEKTKETQKNLSIPLLDEIHYYDYRNDKDKMLYAFRKNQVDVIEDVSVQNIEKINDISFATISSVASAQTGVCRMKISRKPFDNIFFRRAILKTVDTREYVTNVFAGYGHEAEHHHVSPIHPEYYTLPKPEQDVKKALEYLKRSGYNTNTPLTIDVGNTNGVWQENICSILKKQLKQIGITLNINTVSADEYRVNWKKIDFGLTLWVHRPLATMVLNLGYRSGVPWNETDYANPDFDAALAEVDASLDVQQRKNKMKRVETLLQNDSIMVQPFWKPTFFAFNNKVKNLQPHPAQYHDFRYTYIEE